MVRMDATRTTVKHELTGRVFRRVFGALRRRDLRILSGAGRGLPFNAGGSAPSFSFGISERHVQVELQRLLRPGCVFYDLGANVGFYTVIAARLVGTAGTVVAFEPASANLTALRHNIALNNARNVTVVPAAVGARPGHESLLLSAESFWNRLARFDAPPKTRGSAMVEIVTVDRARHDHQLPPPTVVKIDVEGAELLALAGMVATLASSRAVVICEWHHDRDEVTRALEAMGYMVQTLGRDDSRHVIAAPMNAPVSALQRRDHVAT